MKPKDINLNIYEITRLEKKNCDKVLQKISENKRTYTQDELSYIQRMNEYNMFTEKQLKHIVAIFVSLAISKKI
jgi:hypothetical protein